MQLIYNNIWNGGSEFHFGKRYMYKDWASSVCSDITSPFLYKRGIASLPSRREFLTHKTENWGYINNTKPWKPKVKETPWISMWHKDITFSTLSLWFQ